MKRSFYQLLVSTIMILFISPNVIAKCTVKWVDHDYNTMTPAIQKQVCDSTLDIPAINLPGVRPIQRPQISPIQSPTIAPIGTRNCRTQSVFENGQWIISNSVIKLWRPLQRPHRASVNDV